MLYPPLFRFLFQLSVGPLTQTSSSSASASLSQSFFSSSISVPYSSSLVFCSPRFTCSSSTSFFVLSACPSTPPAEHSSPLLVFLLLFHLLRLSACPSTPLTEYSSPLLVFLLFFHLLLRFISLSFYSYRTLITPSRLPTPLPLPSLFYLPIYLLLRLHTTPTATPMYTKPSLKPQPQKSTHRPIKDLRNRRLTRIKPSITILWQGT